MLDIVTSSTTIVNTQVNTGINGILSLAFETTLLALAAGLTWGVKLGLSTIKNGIIRAFASRAVAFAAQRLSDLSDEEKRLVVAQKIHDKFPRLPTEEVDHYLEEAYTNLKAGLSSVNT